MSRGLIISWNYVNDFNNQGVIAGCSPDVHGHFFGFNIGAVSDPGLVNFLRTHPHFSVPPNCNQGPGPNWVNFTPTGQFAIGISSIFHEAPVPTLDANMVNLEMAPAVSSVAIAPEADPADAASSAHAAALSDHAEAASMHARAASMHAQAAEAHAREAARHSAVIDSGKQSDGSSASKKDVDAAAANTDAAAVAASDRAFVDADAIADRKPRRTGSRKRQV